MSRFNQNSIAWIVMVLSIITSLFMIWFLVSTDKSVTLKLESFENSISNIKPMNGKDVTLEQVAEAVGKYCEQRNNCSGLHGADGDSIPGAAGINGTNGTNGTNGENGQNGADGRPPTAEEIAAAVTAYCANNVCKGDTGDQGGTGPAGRTSEQRCVIVEDKRRMEQKYTDAEDWTVLYYLSAGETCPEENA